MTGHRVLISSIGALTTAAVVVGLLAWGLDGLETLSIEAARAGEREAAWAGR